MDDETMRQYYDYSKLQMEIAKLRIPDGYCIICGEKLAGRKRKYCSDECFGRWWRSVTKVWSRTRWEAFERDNFTCQKCGKQYLPKFTEINGVKRIAEMPELIGDHIKPLFLGGAEFDLNNVQTLCTKCSDAKTREEAKLRTKMEIAIRERGQRRLLEVPEK